MRDDGVWRWRRTSQLPWRATGPGCYRNPLSQRDKWAERFEGETRQQSQRRLEPVLGVPPTATIRIRCTVSADLVPTINIKVGSDVSIRRQAQVLKVYKKKTWRMGSEERVKRKCSVDFFWIIFFLSAPHLFTICKWTVVSYWTYYLLIVWLVSGADGFFCLLNSELCKLKNFSQFPV